MKHVRRFHADLVRDKVKPSAAGKAMSVLSAILGLAEADELVPYNPVPRLRRERPKARVPRPLAPMTVEAIRARLSGRDAITVSLLSYAGLRPHELRALRWHMIGERVLSVPGGKTGDRPVRLLAPLKTDLAEWRLKCGRPGDDEFVIPAERTHNGSDGEWSANGFAKWARRVLTPAADAVGRPDLTPYVSEFEDAPRLSAEDAIRQAREQRLRKLG